MGDLDLLIPKLPAGSFLPSIREPRHRVDQALFAVIMEAYIHGVSTRKMDALVSALGSQSGSAKSQVSRIGQEIDAQVQAYLSRPLEVRRMFSAESMSAIAELEDLQALLAASVVVCRFCIAVIFSPISPALL